MTIETKPLYVLAQTISGKMLTILPAFFLMTPSAVAALIVDNRTENVSSTTPSTDYLVRNNGTLNIVQGTTQSIFVESGSTLNISGATITASSGVEGLSITGTSVANINQATVTSETMALTVNRAPGAPQGSTATATDSQFNGGDTGAHITGLSTLNLINTGLTGTASGSSGLNIQGGTVQASAGSRISGDAAGVLMGRDPAGVGTSALKLDGSSATGRNGPAIQVQGGIDASIEVLNGSTLSSANGNLLEVLGASTAAMTVGSSALQGNVRVSDNSTANLTFNQGRMTGDVLVEDDATANVILQNGSQLIGRLNQVDSVTIDASTWTMTGSDTIGELSMAGGTVDFGVATGAFRELNVDTLDGNGTFAMNADFATGAADRLNVTGVANGDFGLEVKATGTDVISDKQLVLVHTAAGPAQFSLVGGRVDLGTWSYDLANSTDSAGGTSWFLNPTTKTVSPGAQSVLALFQTATTISYGEMKSLEGRMGELKSDGNLHGVWVRPFGNKYNVDEESGVAYRQRQQGISLGADTLLGESQWRVGVLAGYSQSDLELDGGTSGNVDSYYFGPYVSWLNADTGYYFDGALKLNHFRNDSDVKLSDGTQTKGDYNNSGVSALVEVGRNIKLADDWFVKPSAQLSAAVIEGADYRLDNGMQADGDRTRSLRGKLGVATGRSFNIDRDTVLQPYARVALVHEFASHDDAQVNGNKLNNSLKGSGFEVGAGVAVSLAKNLRLDAGVDYGKSEKFEQPWAVTLGVSYGF